MVETQLRARNIRDEQVLQAMLKIPRHEFVSPDLVSEAYHDKPLSIGEGQTISQPYIVALMSELLELKPHRGHVLEIGTGCGYQTAILSQLAAEVYTVEINSLLAARAMDTFRRLGFFNIHPKIGDGYLGWPDFAPYDGIIVTAAPEYVPSELIEQLKEYAHLVIPVGKSPNQILYRMTKTGKEIQKEKITNVSFVPMVPQDGL